MGLSCIWICEMDVATRFFMLASDTTMDEKGLDEAVKVILSRFLI